MTVHSGPDLAVQAAALKDDVERLVHQLAGAPDEAKEKIRARLALDRSKLEAIKRAADQALERQRLERAGKLEALRQELESRGDQIKAERAEAAEIEAEELYEVERRPLELARNHARDGIELSLESVHG